MPDRPDLEVAKAALAVSRESVTNQQAHVRDLRTSAAALLTGTALAVAFLGGRAVDVAGFAVLVIVGLVCFGLSLVLIFTVLIPGFYRGQQIKEIGSGAALLRLRLRTPSPEVRDVYVHEQLTRVYDSV